MDFPHIKDYKGEQIRWPRFEQRHKTPLTEEQKKEGFRVDEVILVQMNEDGTEQILGEYTAKLFRPSCFDYIWKNGKAYALHTGESYTQTRILEITPDVGIKDIGGQDNSSWGLCPVEYVFLKSCGDYFNVKSSKKYIQEWQNALDGKENSWSGRTDLADKLKWKKQEFEEFENRESLGYDFMYYTPKEGAEGELSGHFIKPLNYALVGGCVWGGPYEIRYYDISEIEKGILTECTFKEFIELPDNRSLRESVLWEQTGDGGVTLDVPICFKWKEKGDPKDSVTSFVENVFGKKDENLDNN